MSNHAEDTANVVGFPPLYFVGPLVAGLLLQRKRPASLLPGPLARLVGLPLLVGGIALARWGFQTMRRADVSPDVHRPVAALVTDGPFGYTRNPLYLSLTLTYLGIAFLFNAQWPVLWLPGVLLAVERGVIDREERYLERRFGAAYVEYRARVHRWL
jgi:protein-S-isoprenylcysteine O-methyltransferase Ste14